MKLIDENFYNTRFPVVSDFDLSKFDDNGKKVYLAEYSLYSSFLYDYLIKHTSIKRSDDTLKNSTIYEFPTISEDDMDLYQYLSIGKLNYFYIRNNIYIERLSKEEHEFLVNRIKNKKYEFDDEVDKFINDTFKKLIFENVDEKNTPNIDLNFGPSSSYSFYASNDSLVIGERFYPYVKDLSTDELRQKYMDRQMYISDYLNKVKEILTNELKMNVAVIEYDEGSIKKKDSLTNQQIKL